ncbi:hypothetical protein [Saccharopolyspora flava]|uniref:hypothetical protein n=1 Tax=Saccharopolyspora flava TaxID=95161 RepID=UPI00111485B2|nr:hypothetical protein [Saccharopolyspora flava]
MRLLTEGWCGPGEKLAFIIGGPQKSGWFGATTSDGRGAPYEAGHDVLQPPWPSVNSLVATGEHLADEWVHDPAVFGWAHASGPQQAAPRSAAALNSGRHLAWLVCSNQRLAVVVEADTLAEAKGTGGESGFLGGLLGKGRANAGEVETWWELPTSGIAGFAAADLGRGFDPVEFFRIGFADGSVLEFRMKDAAELVKVAEERL